MYRKLYLLIILLTTLYTNLHAFTDRDSITISLLTAEPGNEVYEKFGHTAIRVRAGAKDDLVFNYGLFSFNTPNFLYRFVKGETDYQLGVTEFPYFNMEYALRGSKVYEQVLNLSQEDAKKVLNALIENYKPKNRVYRYNYFYDNCSTRPYEIIENNITGSIESRLLGRTAEKSYRDYVHLKTSDDKWLTFGIDLCLGYKADMKIDYRQEMFLPDRLLNYFENAEISRDSVTTKLVKSTIIYNETKQNEIQKGENILSLFTPLTTFWALFIIILLICIKEFKRNKIYEAVDSVVFFFCGIAGTIIWFLNFFSTHPTVDGNLNCIWLRPFYLIISILVWVKIFKKVLYYYHFANFALLTLLLVCYAFLPQHFNAAFFPLIGIIMLRSGINVKTYGIKHYR